MHSVSSARRQRTRHVRVLLLALLGVLALAVPSTASAVVYIEGQPSDQMDDFDSSEAIHMAPTAAQATAAKSLHANVTWSQFGTPGSIFNTTGYVATGVKGSTA